MVLKITAGCAGEDPAAGLLLGSHGLTRHGKHSCGPDQPQGFNRAISRGRLMGRTSPSPTPTSTKAILGRAKNSQLDPKTKGVSSFHQSAYMFGAEFLLGQR